MHKTTLHNQTNLSENSHGLSTIYNDKAYGIIDETARQDVKKAQTIKLSGLSNLRSRIDRMPQPITARKFVLDNVCPYSEQFDCQGEPDLDRLPESVKLEYASIKFREYNYDINLDVNHEICMILSEDKEVIERAVKSIQKKLIAALRDSLSDDFNDTYGDYLEARKTDHQEWASCPSGENPWRADHAA